MGLTLFIWSVTEDRLPQETANSSIEVFEKLRHLLPEYHTHEMKNNSIKGFVTCMHRQIYHHIYLKQFIQS